MNRGRKLGPRRYSSVECSFIVKELFENQARVTIKDICNATGVCRQTAARHLDIVTIFFPVYQATDIKPYEYSILRR